jgi:hypothetical protein
MKRRLSDDTLIVTTDDGTMFRCSLSALAREGEPRWVLLDSHGAQFIGPPVTKDRSQAAVRKQINDWWAARKDAAPPAQRDRRPLR